MPEGWCYASKELVQVVMLISAFDVGSEASDRFPCRRPRQGGFTQMLAACQASPPQQAGTAAQLQPGDLVKRKRGRPPGSKNKKGLATGRLQASRSHGTAQPAAGLSGVAQQHAAFAAHPLPPGIPASMAFAALLPPHSSSALMRGPAGGQPQPLAYQLAALAAVAQPQEGPALQQHSLPQPPQQDSLTSGPPAAGAGAGANGAVSAGAPLPSAEASRPPLGMLPAKRGRPKGSRDSKPRKPRAPKPGQAQPSELPAANGQSSAGAATIAPAETLSEMQSPPQEQNLPAASMQTAGTAAMLRT